MEIRPVTAGRFDGAVSALSGGGEACLCQYWRMSSGEFSRWSVEKRLAALRAQIDQAPPPGLVA